MPAPIKPMLGDLELPLVQRLETTEVRVLVDHPVPGLAGDLTQPLNRRTTALTVYGVLVGDEARDRLEGLRQPFHTCQPLPFVADIMTATAVQQMLIADLNVQEVAGKPAQFVYRLTLSEYVAPPPDETEALDVVAEEVSTESQQEVEQRVEEVAERAGTLTVRIELSDENQDLSGVVILVEGRTAAGEPLTFTIEEVAGGVYRRENVPVGDYTVKALGV